MHIKSKRILNSSDLNQNFVIMSRSKLINLSYGDIAPADMTLKLDCWTEELSPSQLAAFEQAEKEHNDIKLELNK